MKKLWLLFSVLITILLTAPLMTEAYEPGDLIKLLPTRADNTFLNRGEYAAMLNKAAALSSTTAILPKDVSATDWYAEGMKNLLGNKIIFGYPDGTIKPKQNVTRVEAVVMLSRVIGLPTTPSSGVSVKGLEKCSWAAGPYTWCVKEGFLDTNADPNGFITPQEGDRLLTGAFATDAKGKEINLKSEAAFENVKTMRIHSMMNMSMDIDSKAAKKISSDVTRLTFGLESYSAINTQEGLHSVITMKMPQVGGVNLPDLKMEEYFLPTGLFIKATDPSTGESVWKKTPKDQTPDFQSSLKQQNSLATAEMGQLFHFRVLNEAIISGEKCYNLDFYSSINDYNKLVSLLNKQMPTESGAKDPLLGQNKEMIDHISFMGNMVVRESDFLPLIVNSQAVISYKKDSTHRFPFSAMNINYQLKYSDFFGEKYIHVKPPTEILSATEITDDNN